ncbi:MAG: replicative DNA helicase [Clostridia bacterium]|nr:replicative DNA helicase [Clostridia bacterium]
MANKKDSTKTAASARVMPNNLEAEQAVLCSAMIDPLAAESIVGSLSVADFYSESHKRIFDVMKQLYKSNKPIDFVSVVDLLEKKEQLESVGGINYITSLSNAVPSSAYHAHYTEIVRRDGTLRQLIETCSEVINKAYEADSTDILGVAEKKLYEIGEYGTPSTLVKMTDSLNEAMSTFEEINKTGGESIGIKTGFIALDKKLGGLQKSDVIILAARPGIGKTTLAMNIVTNAAIEYGAKCAVFNLEMSGAQLAQRMLCSVAGVDMTKARNAELVDSDWVKLWNAHQKLVDANIYCDDNTLNTPSQILQKCRKLKRERGLDLIVIDYLQLMEADDREENKQGQQFKIAAISRRLKVLAKELNVPVLVLSQMSRDITKQVGDKKIPRKPQLSDLRDSGAIEQDADIVIFIDRKNDDQEVDENGEEVKFDIHKSYVANLIIAKFRNGAPGRVSIGWDGNRIRFVNLSEDANQKSLEKAYEESHGIREVDGDADIFADIPVSELEAPPEEFNMPAEMPPMDDFVV